MKRASVNDLLMYDGELVRVVAVADRKTLVLEPVEDDECPQCGSCGRIHVVEDSPLFQDKAEAVSTLSEASQ